MKLIYEKVFWVIIFFRFGHLMQMIKFQQGWSVRAISISQPAVTVLLQLVL